MSNVVFKNCISLGWYCGTASSMAKYGLRSCSGPFDWYFSDYASVIKQMEDDFRDFMTRDNLEGLEDRPRAFRDTKYGFEVCHDLEHGLDEDYEALCEKYARRVRRFMEMTKEPTLFLRAVRSEEELQYIAENAEYIDSVIKKNNESNVVTYLLLDSMEDCLPEECLRFYLHRNQYQHLASELREMFDCSPELLDYVRKVVEPAVVEENKLFDMDANASCAARIDRMISESDSRVGEAIRELYGGLETDGLYLWGIGYHGSRLYKYLREMNIPVAGAIDTYRAGQQVDDICVMAPSDVHSSMKIFASMADEKVVKDVRTRVKLLDDMMVASYAELYKVMYCGD